MATKTEGDLGCEHYRRKCAFISPCCEKVYTCRLCHDEKETHEIDRKKVEWLRCLQCDAEQKVQRNCESCGVEFGRYFCATCRLYDDVDREQFHCDPCGICRVGGQQNYFHCKKCDMCLSTSCRDSHRCVEKASRSNCPICMEDLHTSRTAVHIPQCGHLIHRPCYKGLMESGNYCCPICGESMGDMTRYWKLLESEVAEVQMPEEYRDMKVWILCKDCHKHCEVPFHVIGMQCQHCSSFNTCRSGDPASEEGATTKTPGADASSPGDGATASVTPSSPPTSGAAVSETPPTPPTSATGVTMAPSSAAATPGGGGDRTPPSSK